MYTTKKHADFPCNGCYGYLKKFNITGLSGVYIALAHVYKIKRNR